MSGINLNSANCVKILMKYTELAQQKGAFSLNEAGILKRAFDVLGSESQLGDPEIDETMAKNLLVQAVHKGQRSGAYTLSDAALLDKVVQALSSQALSSQALPPQALPSQEGEIKPVVQPGSTPIKNQSDQSLDLDSLDDLSAPVPLKPKEI